MNEDLIMKIKTFTGKNPMAPKKRRYVMPKQPKDKVDEDKTPERQLAGELGHQLTPKGPGYHSPEEIAADVREAKKISGLARKVMEKKK